MKRISTIWLGVILIMLSLGACSGTKEADSGVEDELKEFRSWVDSATSNIADKTEEQWKQAKTEFNEQTNNLDQVQDNFTSEVKEEYKQLKQKFNDADSRYQIENKDKMVKAWEQKLLGNWADMSQINESNVREAYITLMENVRSQKGNWTDKDWQMAKMVLENLDQRKSQLSGNVSTETEVKIKALQMEFRTLETAADATDDN